MFMVVTGLQISHHSMVIAFTITTNFNYYYCQHQKIQMDLLHFVTIVLALVIIIIILHHLTTVTIAIRLITVPSIIIATSLTYSLITRLPLNFTTP